MEDLINNKIILTMVTPTTCNQPKEIIISEIIIIISILVIMPINKITNITEDQEIPSTPGKEMTKTEASTPIHHDKATNSTAEDRETNSTNTTPEDKETNTTNITLEDKETNTMLETNSIKEGAFKVRWEETTNLTEIKITNKEEVTKETASKEIKE
jgi:hypothetical protein